MKFSEMIFGTIFFIITFIIVLILTFWATEPEQWYAGEHRIDCNGTENCQCYEMFLKNDKEMKERK